jgi:Uma2 family endonuclease
MTSQTDRNPVMSDKTATDYSAEWEFIKADLEQIEIEDDCPVDNLVSEKQQRLLVASLYSDLRDRQPFLAAANVGLFYGKSIPPLVPDVLLSFGIAIPEDWSEKENRSYFTWNFGKLPEVAIEIVSNAVGNELGNKLNLYESAGVGYYVVFDPLQFLTQEKLQVFARGATHYHKLQEPWLAEIDLGLRLWEGEFEGKLETWLRWCRRDGTILRTGDERAEIERERADRLGQKLRELGIDPDTL